MSFITIQHSNREEFENLINVAVLDGFSVHRGLDVGSAKIITNDAGLLRVEDQPRYSQVMVNSSLPFNRNNGG